MVTADEIADPHNLEISICDTFSTGTPPGVGFARKPPRYLRDGDDCVVAVEGIGELRNPVVSE